MDCNKLCYCFSAPSIYENQDIKKGIMCQLFGGASKDFTSAGRGKFRSVTCLRKESLSTTKKGVRGGEILILKEPT